MELHKNPYLFSDTNSLFPKKLVEKKFRSACFLFSETTFPLLVWYPISDDTATELMGNRIEYLYSEILESFQLDKVSEVVPKNPYIIINQVMPFFVWNLLASRTWTKDKFRSSLKKAEKYYGDFELSFDSTISCSEAKIDSFLRQYEARRGSKLLWEEHLVKCQNNLTGSESFLVSLRIKSTEDYLAHALIILQKQNGVCFFLRPTYNSDFARISPGIILLNLLGEHLSQNGFTSIDLGPGDESYKYRFAEYFYFKVQLLILDNFFPWLFLKTLLFMKKKLRKLFRKKLLNTQFGLQLNKIRQ